MAIMEVTHGKNHFYLTELRKEMKRNWRNYVTSQRTQYVNVIRNFTEMIMIYGEKKILVDVTFNINVTYARAE